VPPHVYLLEFSRDDLSDTTPTWTDITAYLLEGSFQRGSSGPDLDEPQAGTATFRLDNRSRRFEPEYAAGAYFPDIRPLRRIRLTIDSVVQFTGFVTSWGQNWPDALMNQEAVVTCVDAQEILNLDTLPSLDPPDASSYDEMVGFDEPFGYWTLNEPQGTAVRTRIIYPKRKFAGHRVIWLPYNWKPKYRITQSLGAAAGNSGTYRNTPRLGEPGAIIGDPDTSVRFTASQSQYAVVPVDQENAVDTNQLTIEAWVKLASTSTNRTIIGGPFNTTASAPVFFLNQTGGTKWGFGVELTNGNIAVVASTTSQVTDTWVHLVGTWDGAAARIYVNALLESEDYSQSGKVMRQGDAGERLHFGAEKGGLYYDGWLAKVAIYEHALAQTRITAHYNARPLGLDTQTAAARFSSIATNPLWSLITAGGSRSLQPIRYFGQTRIEEIRDAMHSEWPHSQFYVNGNGNPTYLGWEYQSTGSYNTVRATFGNFAGEVPYEDLALTNDEDALYNDVSATRDGGEPQRVIDTTSQNRYYRRAYEISGTLNTEDEDAKTIAAAILEEHKEPGQRIENFVLNGADATAQTQILNREPGDLVRVKHRPKGGTAIDRVARIRSKQVSISRGHAQNPLIGTFTLSRGFNAALSEWKLGISGFSELGSTAVLG
jgi:concanavalin A-like lectin/glucanase superfamily protein